MALRELLTYAHDDGAFNALSNAAANEGGAVERAFVSQSLRPYLTAALVDDHRDRPALIVTGDDRAARDLAADLRAFMRPRLVRLYPARGVRSEAPRAPPPPAGVRSDPPPAPPRPLVGFAGAALASPAPQPGPEAAAIVVPSPTAFA